MTKDGGKRRGGLGAGFTLTELIVAMGIGMVLLLIILGVLRVGGDGYDAATRRIDSNVEARAALAALTDDAGSLQFDENFQIREESGPWTSSELSFMTFKPRSAQDSKLASGDLCFAHYYTAVTRQLEGESGPYSRKLYRRLVSSGAVMDQLQEGGDFRDPVKDPERVEDEAVAFNVVQFLVKAMVRGSGGGLSEWDGEFGVPDYLEVTLRVTDNRTAALLPGVADWSEGSELAGRLLGSESDPEAGKRLQTYYVVIPVNAE